MAKYQSRFDNFFLNLRLNRAEFGDMAAFTLAALRKAPEAATTFKDLITALEAALTAYQAAHSGQLSGAGKEATLTVAQALTDFKGYVKRVERKYVNPAYDEGSADLEAIFPRGRSGLTGSSQATVLEAFTAFLNALAARAAVFPVALREEGAALHKALKGALQRADGAQKDTKTGRTDLHDGREATCRQLFRAYALLLLTYYENPRRAAAFFDLSRALISKSGGKSPKELLPPQ
ncbi:hypothetical protein HER32_04315 [Hymenobacter sp. BT18]|uniref:hypothetical protein n=1 Tax=Hymenobacter sp. BT18 TaxID=2835648 RepID=UPI00143ED35E|nr:hypothetical protein [Hymenobacter sp. BT18]QIX60452.1 hypothetical protein HER32_04315 [Hymenobacter sp. BT18]